jgi:hypothetical protein
VTLTELTERDYLQSVWQALRRIEAALSGLVIPPPEVSVTAPPPDLADIVTAVTSLKPGPSAEDIARALADVLVPNRDSAAGDEALGQVARALEKLDFRLQGMGTQAYGGGSVTLQRGQVVGISNWDEMPPTSVGTVEITNDVGNPIPVSGTFWQATQPVSGTITVANPTTNPETGLAKDATLLRRYGDHVTKAGVVSTIGDNTLHTPAAGRRIRLYWVGLSTSQDNTAENLIQVKLTDADGTVKYRWYLGNPGAFVGGRTIEGNVDEPLILNLATADPVSWNVDLEEVT